MAKLILKMLREEHHYTQKYVASILHMSQSEYSRLENGQRKLQYSAAKILADLYGVDINMLMEACG